MNTLLLRRRWLIVRPWLKDALSGLGLIALMVLGYIAMDRAAQLCQLWRWCAG